MPTHSTSNQHNNAQKSNHYLHSHHELTKADSKSSDLSNVTVEVIGTHKDIQLDDDSLEIKGNLKIKRITQSIVEWDIPIYDDIIIERIYGEGKLYYHDDYQTSHHHQHVQNPQLLKHQQLIYDSRSSDRILCSNTKYIRLHSGHAYLFKLAKYEDSDEIVVHYRNKYSLDL